MELGVLYESMGRDGPAEQAYRTAIRVEPGMTGPRSNLAALLDRRLEEETRRASGGPPTPRMTELQRELEELRGRETELLARDARLLPESAGLQYRYGLALYLTGDHAAAERALREACRLDPENDQFLQAMVLFLDRHERYDEALQGAQQLLEMRPGNPEYLRIREMIEHKRRPGRSAPASDTANTRKETE